MIAILFIRACMQQSMGITFWKLDNQKHLKMQSSITYSLAFKKCAAILPYYV